jgi:hypothetical protein
MNPLVTTNRSWTVKKVQFPVACASHAGVLPQALQHGMGARLHGAQKQSIRSSMLPGFLWFRRHTASFIVDKLPHFWVAQKVGGIVGQGPACRLIALKKGRLGVPSRTLVKTGRSLLLVWIVCSQVTTRIITSRLGLVLQGLHYRGR